MTPKERVKKTLRREGAVARPPLQFDLSLQQIRRFSELHDMPVELSAAYYEDLTYRISANALRTRMGSDCVVVGTGVGSGFEIERSADGSYTNEFGMRMRQGQLYVDVVEHPLSQLASVGELEEFQFPNPHDPYRYQHAEHDIKRFGDEYFVIGDAEVTIYALARQLMGMEPFLVSLMQEEPFIDPLLQRCMQWSLGIASELAERGAEAIWFGDDFGTQESLVMSPTLFRERFKPLYAQLIGELKQLFPEVLVIFHSDGAVAPLLPDFIEIGVDVFNPVQPGVPGHDPCTLKREFGDRLSFFGAIDQQHLLPHGTPQEIRGDVREKIDALSGEDGGYMPAPAHIIQADTPKENVEAFIQAVLEFKY